MQFRPNTTDSEVFRAVYTENEYQLDNISGDTVLDIGAHIGSFSRLAAESGAKTVLAIEPHPVTFNLLKTNLRQFGNVECLNMAASDQFGIAELVYLGDTSNMDYGQHAIKDAAIHGYSAGTSYRVVTMRLEAFAKVLGGVDWIKADCEGSELLFENDLSIARKGVFGEIHLRAGDPRRKMFEATLSRSFRTIKTDERHFWAWK